MAGKTIYQKAKDMLNKSSERILTLSELRQLIIMHIGADNRTISKYLSIMKETELITDIGNSRFQIKW